MGTQGLVDFFTTSDSLVLPSRFILARLFLLMPSITIWGVYIYASRFIVNPPHNPMLMMLDLIRTLYSNDDQPSAR